MASDNNSAAAEDNSAERGIRQGKKSTSTTRQAQPNGCARPQGNTDTQAPTMNGTADHSSGAAALQPAENGTAENGASAETSSASVPGSPLGETGRQHGRELIASLRHARHVLRAGLQNLAAVREEAMYAQRAFYPLIRQLDEVEGLLSRRSKEAGESNVALAAARTWVMAAQTTVQELDANVSGILLDGNAASCLAPDWAMYAQAAALKLRDLEEDLWGGQIFGQPVKPTPAKPGATGARRITPRSALSYTHHWRRKVAM